MNKFIPIVLFLSLLFAGNSHPSSVIKFLETTGGAGGTDIAYDFRDEFSDTLAAGSVNGTLSTSGHVRTVVDTYATVNLMTNGGFETVTSAGPPADFGTWSDVVNDGNIEVETVSVKTGTNAIKLTAGAGALTYTSQSANVIAGKTYTFSMWTRGDGTNAGRYTIYGTGNGYIASAISTGVTGTTYTFFSVTVTPTVTESLSFYLTCPSTNGGVAYFDDVSVLPTSGLLTIANGALTFAGGKASPAYGDPGIWYPSITRTSGLGMVCKFTGTTAYQYIGFGTNTSGAASTASIFLNGATDLRLADGGGTPPIGTVTDSVTYNYAVFLRSVSATGEFFLVKGGTEFPMWTLAYVIARNGVGTLYPGITGSSGSITSSFIRIPSMRWLPSPLISHGMSAVTPADGAGHAETTGLGSGGSGVTLTGATWAVSSGTAVNTPTEGASLVDAAASTFESAGGVYSWLPLGTNTVENDANTLKTTYVDNGDGAKTFFRDSNDLSSDLTVGAWYLFRTDVKNSGGNNGLRLYNGITETIPCYSSFANFTSCSSVFRSTSSTAGYLKHYGLGAGEIIWLDNFTLNPLTLSSLFLTAPLSTANVLASVEITKTAATNGYQSGLVTNLDSASSPANFLIHYMDGAGNCKTDKNVAGTYTNIISAACTYSPGAPMVAVTDAGAVRLYYNNILVGTATVADAGVISNTIHGLFSTGSDQLDDLVIYPRGNEGQYSLLNQFIN